MGGIRVIAPAAADAQAAFAEHGEVAWVRGLSLVLEKHGLLDVDEAGPDALADGRALQRYAAVLVGRVPAAAWTAAAVDAVADARTIVEGPLPPALAERLGITADGPEHDIASVVVRDGHVRGAALRYAHAVGARLSDPSGDEAAPVDRHAAAWRRPGWSAERWTDVGDATVLCDALDTADPPTRRPCVVRHGTTVACAFGLLSFLVQRHTADPYVAGETRVSDRCIGLETVLLALIDDLYRRAERVRPRVLPWPGGAEWALAVRHDVDTPSDVRDVERVVAAHGSAAATWAWRPVAAQEAAAAVAAVTAVPAHEIALLGTGAPEQPATLSSAIGRRPVSGAVLDQSPAAQAPRGADFARACDASELVYTEILERAHLHPHRIPVVTPDGLVEPLDVVALPHYESLAHLVGLGDGAAERVGLWRTGGGLLTLRAPVDGQAAGEVRALDGPLFAGVRRTTLASAARWWRRTHRRGALTIDAATEGTLVVRAAERSRDVAIELLHPDGTRDVRVVDVGPEAVTIDARPRELVGPVSWDATHQAYAAAIAEYYRVKGVDGGSSGSHVSTANNTVHVPARAELVLGLVRDVAGRRLAPSDVVLDVGCGFGGIAAYLAWTEGLEQVIGVDQEVELLDAARAAAAAIGLDGRVRFEEGDMRSLSGIPDGSVDVVIANGVLMYPQTAGQLRRALREFRRVLRPGGHLVTYQASRWQRRDPISGERVLHLLPNVAQRAVAAGRGRTRLRKRWVSPPELRRALLLSGFRDQRLVGFFPDRRMASGWQRHLGRTFALTASRPGQE